MSLTWKLMIRLWNLLISRVTSAWAVAGSDVGAVRYTSPQAAQPMSICAVT